jgi:nucleotide-binding universal stress UspA family protein
MLPIQTVLHPTDFSVRSRAAFDVACSLARDRGALLVVLHVNDTAAALSSDDEGVRRIAAALSNRLHSLRPDESVVAMEYLLETGNPPDVILRVANDLAADLIVMGTHGHTGLARALLGSVAEAVVRAAACPVLTIRMPMTPQGKPTRSIPSAAVPVM